MTTLKNKITEILVAFDTDGTLPMSTAEATEAILLEVDKIVGKESVSYASVNNAPYFSEYDDGWNDAISVIREKLR